MDAHGAAWTRTPANGHAWNGVGKGFKDETPTLSQKLSSEYRVGLQMDAHCSAMST